MALKKSRSLKARKRASKQLPVVGGHIRTTSGDWRKANQAAVKGKETPSYKVRSQKAVRKGKTPGSKGPANQKQSHVRR